MKQDPIETLIPSLLQKGSLPTDQLIDAVRKKRPHTTKQAVYAALRKLRKEDKVVMEKQRVALSQIWVKKMHTFFTVAQKFYAEKRGDEGNFLELEDGEKIEWFFADPHQTDAFWAHASILLCETNTDAGAIFCYYPHEWFLIARAQSELNAIKYTNQVGMQFLAYIGHDSYLDRHLKKHFDGENSQYYVAKKPLFPKENYYVNVIGDFLIEAWIHPDIANKVHQVFESTTKLTTEVTEELERITSAKGRMRFVISRNKKKAARIRTMMEKHFFVFKSLLNRA